MVHHKETNVAIKQHEGEVTSAFIVDDSCVLVGKSAKTEHIGDGFVVNVVNECWSRATAVVVVIGNEAWQCICMDAGGIRHWIWQVRACDGWLARPWCRTYDAFAGSLHMTFRCGRAGHELLLD